MDEAVGLFWGWDTHESFRETRPEPYSNSDYFSPEFLKESFQQPGRWLFDDINNVVMPANYKGQ